MPTLKEVRVKKLMTMRELADKAGIALSTLYGIESGKSVPSLRVIRRLSEVLDTPPENVTEFAEALAEASRGKATPLAA